MICCNRFEKKSREDLLHKFIEDILYSTIIEDDEFQTARSMDLHKKNEHSSDMPHKINYKSYSLADCSTTRHSDSYCYSIDYEFNKTENQSNKGAEQHFHSNDQSKTTIIQSHSTNDMGCSFEPMGGQPPCAIRTSFINRLQYKHDHSSHSDIRSTVFIYDWDDTFLATSFINKSTPPYSETYMKALAKIAKLSRDIIKKSQAAGRVYIVTNALATWVRYSCNRYMPEVSTLLDRIEIISAREMFEESYPGRPMEWKQFTFKYLAQRYLHADQLTNLVCMGDRGYEISSAVELKQTLTNAFLKTIKLRRKPTPIELQSQLEIVSLNLDNIVSRPKDLTIILTKRD